MAERRYAQALEPWFVETNYTGRLFAEWTEHHKQLFVTSYESVFGIVLPVEEVVIWRDVRTNEATICHESHAPIHTKVYR